jgi:hypothetical protein
MTCEIVEFPIADRPITESERAELHSKAFRDLEGGVCDLERMGQIAQDLIVQCVAGEDGYRDLELSTLLSRSWRRCCGTSKTGTTSAGTVSSRALHDASTLISKEARSDPPASVNRSAGGLVLEAWQTVKIGRCCSRSDHRESVMIDFDYDLDEMVQMEGTGTVSLRTALINMPDRVGPLGVLYRDAGKTPAFFMPSKFKLC